MLRLVHRWAARRGLRVSLTGVDLYPWSARAAAAATPQGMAIKYVTADLFDYRPSQPPDIIPSSLFAHHLPDDSLVRFLRWMDASAGLGWFVNDLRRSPAAYRLFGVGTAVGGWHRFIRPKLEEHTSELPSLMRISYAVFCLKKKNKSY